MIYNEYLQPSFENPRDYYWAQINKSLDAMTQRQDTKNKWINQFQNSLNKAATKLGVHTDSKEMNAQLCFKACQAVLMETVLTFGEPPHVAYALEYFNYAPTRFDLGENPRSVNIDQTSFYNRLLDRLENTLLTNVNSAILNNTSGSFSNTVVDLDKLRRDLKQTVNNFYSNNPEFKQSTDRMPELQSSINKMFSALSLNFDKKVRSNKNSTYGL